MNFRKYRSKEIQFHGFLSSVTLETITLPKKSLAVKKIPMKIIFI